MTLTELRYALALAKEKHFGKAAACCHVSQPTLSVAIHKLELELGVAIFERDRNVVRITEIGKKIIQQAQRTIDEANLISEIGKTNQSQLTSPLKVGAIYTVGPYLFPNLIPALKKISPEMPLFIHEDFTAKLREQLLQGELDAIFISLPFEDNGVVTQALYDEPFVIVMRNDHPLCHLDKIDPNDLSADELLLLGEEHCFRDQVMEACPKCYQNENTHQRLIEGTSLDTLKHMVASGLGITVLPSSAVQQPFYQSLLCCKAFSNHQPKRTVALAWRMSFTRPKAIGVLIEALKTSGMHGVSLSI